MKLFIKKIFLFTIVFGIFSVIVGQIYLHNYLKIVFSEEAFRLPENITTVFFGDSHANTTFDPEIIENSFNASVESEIYFTTYSKMKSLLKSNPQIKNVVLSHGYHNLSFAYNKDILFSDKYYSLFDQWGKEIIHSAANGQLLEYKYGPFNSFFSRWFAYLEHFVNSTFIRLKYDVGVPVNLTDYLNFYVSILRNNPKLNEFPLYPGNYRSDKSNLEESLTNKFINLHYYIDGEVGSSGIMIESLYRMAETCREYNVNFFLINTPIHSSFKSKIPEYYIKLYDEVLIDLKDKFDNIYYYDFSSVDYPDSLFGDGDHLNAPGMERFSNEIKDLFTE
ncbi:MAG TPA: hypothetical protein VLH59_05530 [Ignavibacteriaceae bacterium]|nr:hypothetical protein [Ignavibacteriaceae bacterium]